MIRIRTPVKILQVQLQDLVKSLESMAVSTSLRIKENIVNTGDDQLAHSRYCIEISSDLV